MLSRKRCHVDDWMYESGTERKGQNWMYVGVISIWQASEAMGLEITGRGRVGGVGASPHLTTGGPPQIGAQDRSQGGADDSGCPAEGPAGPGRSTRSGPGEGS